MLLLDTGALIELERELDEDRVGPTRSFLGRARGVLACSTVALGELAVGSSDTAVRVLLQRFRKVSLSEAIAFRAAALERDLAARGQRLGENDNWIAATALYLSATLVFTDGDFGRVPGLKRHRITPS